MGVIKEGKFSIGTGNRMCENINYVIYECDECYGEGYFEMYLWEAIDYLRGYYWGDFSFKDFRKYIKKNVKYLGNGVYKVICQECNGAGKFEEWY
ncbi:MAG: hypothetical protein N2Z20_01130 [Elusimicrobiales bacterium]|nr:hypothetical protein [Elusimicrobiales bacterium]